MSSTYLGLIWILVSGVTACAGRGGPDEGWPRPVVRLLLEGDESQALGILREEWKRGLDVQRVLALRSGIVEADSDWRYKPFLDYLVAREYADEYWYRRKTASRETALAEYQALMDRQPDARFPQIASFELSGALMAPSAMIDMAGLWAVSDAGKAVELYLKVAKAHPSEIASVRWLGYLRSAPRALLEAGWILEDKLHEHDKAMELYKYVATQFRGQEEFNEYVWPGVAAGFQLARLFKETKKDLKSAEKVYHAVLRNKENVRFLDLHVENDCQQVREAKPQALQELARIALRRHQFGRALGLYRRIVAEYPGSFAGAYESEGCTQYAFVAIDGIAGIYHQTGNPRGGIRELRNISVSHDDRFVRSYSLYRLGRFLEGLGRKKEAIEQYQKVVRDNSADGDYCDGCPVQMAEERLKELNNGEKDSGTE